MKTVSSVVRLVGFATIFTWLLVLAAEAADNDYRTFVSKNNRRIVAKLVKVKGDQVTIERKTDKREFTLEINEFSDADQRYIKKTAKEMDLVEEPDEADKDDGDKDDADGDAPPRPRAAAGGKLFEFQTADFKTRKTKHFLIKYNGKTMEPAKSYAEKVWSQCAKVMPKLESDFNGGFRAPGQGKHPHDFPAPDDVFRYRIYVIDENPVFTSLAKEHMDRATPVDKQATRMQLIQTVGMFDDFENRYLVHDMNPGRGGGREIQMSHGLASNLLQMQARRNSLPLWMAAGIGYYIEHEMFDRCRVYYLNFTDYYKGEGGKFEKGEILDGDTPWTRPLRKMVKAGHTESLNRVTTCEVGNMTPPVSGFMFGLTAFMLSTEERAAKYHKMISEIAAGAAPTEAHMLKCMGYGSAKAFESDWHEWMGSGKFK